MTNILYHLLWKKRTKHYLILTNKWKLRDKVCELALKPMLFIPHFKRHVVSFVLDPSWAWINFRHNYPLALLIETSKAPATLCRQLPPTWLIISHSLCTVHYAAWFVAGQFDKLFVSIVLSYSDIVKTRQKTLKIYFRPYGLRIRTVQSPKFLAWIAFNTTYFVHHISIT